MKSVLRWTGEMSFEAKSDENSVVMDAKAPLGKGHGQTPKELVAAGLGGCTAMDVVALIKKHKQPLESLAVKVDIETSSSGYPSVFTHACITFEATGSVDAKILLEAVHLSQTRYCGVSAMLSKAFPIEYLVLLNGQEVGRGKAEF